MIDCSVGCLTLPSAKQYTKMVCQEDHFFFFKWVLHCEKTSISISWGDTFKWYDSSSMKSRTNAEWLFSTDLSTFLPLIKGYKMLPYSLMCRGETHFSSSLSGSISIWENAKTILRGCLWYLRGLWQYFCSLSSISNMKKPKPSYNKTDILQTKIRAKWLAVPAALMDVMHTNICLKWKYFLYITQQVIGPLSLEAFSSIIIVTDHDLE